MKKIFRTMLITVLSFCLSLITICTRVTGESIELIASPLLASQSVDTVQIRFDFDDAWDGFGRIALFWGVDDEVYTSQIVNGLATVPHEALSDAGRIRFGAYGTNGTKRIVTIKVTYKVVEGAYSSVASESIDPSPDLIDQIETSIGELESVINGVKNSTVRFDANQELTDAQKEIARGNIDATSVAALEAQATATTEALAGKVALDQGVAQAGKMLVVDENGSVTTGDAVQIDDTLQQVGQAADAAAVGTALNGKVAVQQGSGNAGKALVVGEDGAVALGEAGVPERVKVALLDIAQHVAYIDDQGQRYYDALYAALYGGESVDYYYKLTNKTIAGESDVIVEHLDLLGSDISYSIVLDAQENGFDFTGSTEYSPEKGYMVFALGNSAEIGLAVMADQTRERVQYRLSVFGNYLRAWMDGKPANSNRHVRMAMSHEAGSGKVKARIIVDGVEATLGTLIENNWAYNYAVTSDVVRIGHLYNTELEMITRLFQGTINDFTIYNYAMTDDEISAYMDAE